MYERRAATQTAEGSPQGTTGPSDQASAPGFAKVDLPLSEPPGRKEDPELKDAVMGHEYIEPLRWKKPNVLILQRHDYYRSRRPDGTITDVGRIWEITVTFVEDGKLDVKWKRDPEW